MIINSRPLACFVFSLLSLCGIELAAATRVHAEPPPQLRGTPLATPPAIDQFLNQAMGIGTSGETRARPNVLLLLTDDIGIDQVPLYGYGVGLDSVPPTPTLKSLQDVGLTFRDAWTMPACSTARGALFTGRYPFRTQLQAALGPSDLANSMISPWEVTIPKLMSRAGYATALFGKFHLGLQGNNPYGLGMVHQLGWDYFNGWLDETGDPSSIDVTAGGVADPDTTYPNGYVPGSNFGGADAGACYDPGTSCTYLQSEVNSKNPAGRQCRDSGGIFDPDKACTTPRPDYLKFGNLSAHYVSPLVISEGRLVYAVPARNKAARTFRNVQQTDAAIAWIKRQQRARKPWFATMSTATVHTPLQVPPYDIVPLSAPDPNGVDPSTSEGAIIIANQMIQAADHEFARLLLSTGLARKSGGKVVPTLEAANTVIIYVNDNGSLGSQVRAPFDPFRAKGTPYQTGVLTPMVVAGPIVKTRPGREVSAMVNVADLYELIGNIGGIDVRRFNPRKIDSVTMLPYFLNPNARSIRKYSFTLVGPNLQAEGGANGPCQFPGTNPPSCSQIPVTKGVCEDNGGTWFGVGADASYPTPDELNTTPIPSAGIESCCKVQKWIADNGGTPGTVVPTTGIAVRDTEGYKLVRNLLNDYDPSSPDGCKPTQFDELYVVNQETPVPRIDTPGRLIETPYTSYADRIKFETLSTYMDNMLASEPDCLSMGDGNDDGVVNREDLANFRRMVKLTSGSSWYDVNTDGVTDDADRQIIYDNQGLTCGTD